MKRSILVTTTALALCLPASVPALAQTEAAVDVPTAGAPIATTTVVPAKFRRISRAEARSRPVLQRGSRGAWVAAVQKALRAKPYDGIFGRKTARKVKRFRKRNGLRPRPKVNVRTWRKLGTRVIPPNAAPTPKPAPAPTPAPAPKTSPAPRTDDYSQRPVLRYSHVSAWVEALQTALGLSADGVFGPATEAGVKRFQSSVGLPATGVVDAATWAKLGSRVTPPPVDVTTTDLAKTSRAHRQTIRRTAFVNSWTAQLVTHRESRGDCAAVSPGGKYRGKWQMDSNFWSYYGGLAYAPTPDQATCTQQDKIARKGWIDRWWQPWPTAIP